MAEHTITLKQERFRILVIGAGGNGSSIFLALPYLHQAMRVWGHPGLDVTLMDGDNVTLTNCIRQPFAQNDIGQNKATVLVNRVNLFWQLDWKAAPRLFTAKEAARDALYRDRSPYDLIIGCVDSKYSRKAIHDALTAKDSLVRYWLDLGNGSHFGQYVLGQPLNAANKKAKNRLRTIAELYPEVIDLDTPEDTQPSCSAIEALQRQEPFTNQALAMQALAMLTQLLRYGKTDYHGGFYNARTGQATPIAVPEPVTRKRK